MASIFRKRLSWPWPAANYFPMIQNPGAGRIIPDKNERARRSVTLHNGPLLK
jgi:hypothetical protein